MQNLLLCQYMSHDHYKKKFPFQLDEILNFATSNTLEVAKVSPNWKGHFLLSQ
jgi:hypothetical protein